MTSGVYKRIKSPWNKGLKVKQKYPQIGFQLEHKHNLSERWKEKRDFIKQNPKPNKCEACGISAKELKKGLHLDHDHKTGKSRGWLCVRCNTALGSVKDSVETLTKLIKYLKK